MPMNPILVATLRRNWPVVGTVLMLLVFTLVHQIFFQPTLNRYKRVVKEATTLGLSLDPSSTQTFMPPRVFALVAENALPASQAAEERTSGVLTARVLEEFTRLAGAHGMEVLMTEPGAVTQQPQSVTVRAYLKVRGRYDEFVGLLDELARGRKLLAVDRFTMMPGPSELVIDVWVSRYVIKQERRK
jgi:hypothetical protein